MHIKQDARNGVVVLNCFAGVLSEESGKSLGSVYLCGGENISLHLSNEHRLLFK